jgi:membrane dipeptidase
MGKGLMLLLSGTMLVMVPGWTEAREVESAISRATMTFHQSLLTLDAHLDTPASIAIEGWSIGDEHDVHVDYTQVDLPRMKMGGLDGGFFAIYTPQGPLDHDGIAKARNFAILRGLAIREMIAADPANFVLATTAEDAAKIAAQGKRIVYMSIENAYPLGEDVSLVPLYYDMGVRLIGLAHFRNNQFADSSTDPDGEKWGGLSPLGVQLLTELNRLGIVPDASHSSDKVLDDLLRLSKTPILLSHSGCKAIYDHPRNIDDDRLRALAANGGVIQMNAYGSYLRAIKPNPERQKALRDLYASFRGGEMTKVRHDEMTAKMREIDKLYPETDKATFDDFMAHLLHALKIAGVDHVGIGLDWDGGGGVVGMEDVTGLPRITDALLKANYSKEDIAKIWSGNVLRVLAANQSQARAN